MAEHEYYEVNGRQIRVRPTESGQEIDEYGNFHRQPNHFTKGFGEGENPVEADRYILFWGKGCNWSNRASIARELLGLDLSHWAYARDLYQTPGFGDTTDFAAIKKHYHIDCNPGNIHQIIAKGPDEEAWLLPHGREKLSEK